MQSFTILFTILAAKKSIFIYASMKGSFCRCKEDAFRCGYENDIFAIIVRLMFSRNLYEENHRHFSFLLEFMITS